MIYLFAVYGLPIFLFLLFPSFSGSSFLLVCSSIVSSFSLCFSLALFSIPSFLSFVALAHLSQVKATKERKRSKTKQEIKGRKRRERKKKRKANSREREREN